MITRQGFALACRPSAHALRPAAGTGLGISNQNAENGLVILQLPVALPPLLVKRPWVQVAAPAVLLISLIAYAALFYPVLTK